MNSGHLSSYFTGVAAKRLSAVEVNPETSNQHEFNGVQGLKSIFGEQRITVDAHFIYFGDTARVPYGNKSKETIKKFSLEISQFLLDKNIKLLVVACNTASSYALDYLKERINIPIVGVVEPGVNAACAMTKNGKIGVIGTKGTISSMSYQNALKMRNNELKIFDRACPLFVPLVEEGWIDKKVSFMIAEEYLRDLKNSGIDTLILGCTHYPILKNVIAEVMGEKVSIVDSGTETAKIVSKMLESDDKSVGLGKNIFYVSDDTEKFKEFGIKFLEKNIDSVEKVVL